MLKVTIRGIKWAPKIHLHFKVYVMTKYRFVLRRRYTIHIMMTGLRLVDLKIIVHLQSTRYRPYNDHQNTKYKITKVMNIIVR